MDVRISDVAERMEGPNTIPSSFSVDRSHETFSIIRFMLELISRRFYPYYNLTLSIEPQRDCGLRSLVDLLGLFSRLFRREPLLSSRPHDFLRRHLIFLFLIPNELSKIVSHSSSRFVVSYRVVNSRTCSKTDQNLRPRRYTGTPFDRLERH